MMTRTQLLVNYEESRGGMFIYSTGVWEWGHPGRARHWDRPGRMIFWQIHSRQDCTMVDKWKSEGSLRKWKIIGNWWIVCLECGICLERMQEGKLLLFLLDVSLLSTSPASTLLNNPHTGFWRWEENILYGTDISFFFKKNYWGDID